MPGIRAGATDTWVTAETPGYQTRYPAAVWTGTEMIVWGGVSGGKVDPPLDTGGRYDPLTDTWAATSLGAGGRYSHTAVGRARK